MKIVCVHQSAELYGSDRSFLAAIEAIVQYGPKPSDVEGILPGHGPLAARISDAGGTVHFESEGYLRRSLLRRPFSFAAGLLAATWRLARRFRGADVVYVNTLVCASALLACTLSARHARRILHVREIPGRKEIVFFRALIGLSGVEVVYNSQATRLAIGLPGTVVYNGVPGPAVSKLEPGGDDVIQLLMIGRINAWKGQAFLLQALSRSHRPIRLRIVGSAIEAQAHLVEELRHIARLLPDGVTCEFFDFCEDPSEHYRWCHYVVVPSTSPEPFGRVAIEGFSYGKPVIAAAHGGLIEIVDHGQDGFLFEPANQAALVQTVEGLPDPHSREYLALGQRAFEVFASRFSVENYAARISRLVFAPSGTSK